MVTRLRSVNPVQFGLVYGLISGVLGLIFALFYAPLSAVLLSQPGMPKGAGMGIGAMALILFPICYFVIGFIAGLIMTALYNLVAGWTGGVEITLTTPPVPVAVPPATQGYTA